MSPVVRLDFYIFFETPPAELQDGTRTSCSVSSAQPHLPKGPTDLVVALPPYALLPDQLWSYCRAVTPHGFLQVSYLVPICVDILSRLFFTACLACIYLSDKTQFGLKTCLPMLRLKMKFLHGCVFPIYACDHYLILPLRYSCFKMYSITLIRVLFHVVCSILRSLIH